MNPVVKNLGMALGGIAMAISMIQSGDAQVATFGGTGSPSTQGFQSRTEIAALPSSSAANPGQSGFTTLATGGQQSNPNVSAYRAAARADVYPYPYPTSLAPRVAVQTGYAIPRSVPQSQVSNQLSVGTNSTMSSQRKTTQPTTQPPTQPTSFTLPTIAGQTGPQPTAYRQPVYVAPTLGLSLPPTRPVPYCTCQPMYKPVAATSLRTASYQAPTPNGAIGSGVAVAPASAQMTGGQMVRPPVPAGYPAQPVAPSQLAAQGATMGTPMGTGSGTYPPVVRRQNMPPGTYMGRGFIGQPTTYIDGQPMRNLLRYITP